MRTPFKFFRVKGDSMLPAFVDGDAVLVFQWSKGRVGDAVVAKKNAITLVKRVRSIEFGRYFLVGDHREKSTDSRAWGSVGPGQILGKVIARIPRSHRPPRT